MRIRFIKNAAGIGMGYFAGMEISIPDIMGKELILDGYAEELKPKDEIPPDFPGRPIWIDHGFKSLREIKELGAIENLVAFKGIGRGIARRVIDYLETLDQ